MRKILILVFITTIVSCHEKFNGNNEQVFNLSRAKIENKLTLTEKINLEKALRVIILETMSIKLEQQEKYKGKSFNEILLKMVDGLSYSSVTDLAEDILKKNNKKKIKEVINKIETLEIQKNEILTIQKKLNLFKIVSTKLKMRDWFGEMRPELKIDYQYVGKEKLIGTKTIHFELKKKSTNEVIKSTIVGEGDDESVLNNLEIITENMILNDSVLKNTKKFPIENPVLSDYNLVLKVTVLSLVLKEKKVTLPKSTIEQIENLLKMNKNRLVELKSIKGTLDE